jgi:hypothetical protein
MGFVNGMVVLVAVATATSSLGVSGFVIPPTSFVGASARTRTTPIAIQYPNKKERILDTTTTTTTTTELGMVRKKKKPGKDLVQNHEKTWQPSFDELQQFYHQHGHYHVPTSTAEEEGNDWHELSLWLQEQRYQCQLLREGKKARITKKRMNALERCDGALDEPPSSSSSHPNDNHNMTPQATTTVETTDHAVAIPTKNLNTQPTMDPTEESTEEVEVLTTIV